MPTSLHKSHLYPNSNLPSLQVADVAQLFFLQESNPIKSMSRYFIILS